MAERPGSSHTQEAERAGEFKLYTVRPYLRKEKYSHNAILLMNVATDTGHQTSPNVRFGSALSILHIELSSQHLYCTHDFNLLINTYTYIDARGQEGNSPSLAALTGVVQVLFSKNRVKRKSQGHVTEENHKTHIIVNT